jgi:hypothetical protein
MAGEAYCLFRRISSPLLLNAISRCVGWPIVIGVIVLVHIGRVRCAVSPVAVKEAVGLCHPHGLLVVFSSRASSVVKGSKLTEAAVREIAVSVSGTSAMIHAIGFDCIFCLAWAGTIKSRGIDRCCQCQHKKTC